MRSAKPSIKCQLGQAYAETLVGFTVIAIFLFGAHHVWQNAELQQVAVDAVRFAAWERVVWEPDDNGVEKFALHKTDKQIAKDVVLRQLSTPAAWRKFRSGLPTNGNPDDDSDNTPTRRRELLNTAVKSFVSSDKDPNNMVSVSTSSGWKNTDEKWRGVDPTDKLLTSLTLDQQTWRTVELELSSLLSSESSEKRFGFTLPAVSTKKHLTLITNSWAASPPLMFVRDRQLLPLSTGDAVSGTPANRLAYGGGSSTSNAELSDFFGLVPLWNAVGGPRGFGGQYIVNSLGLSASASNEIIGTGGSSYQPNPADPLSWAPVMPQLHQPEYFNSNAVSNWHHRHTFVIANTAAHAGEPDTKAQNSNIGKLKYRALSPRNPTDTYFSR